MAQWIVTGLWAIVFVNVIGSVVLAWQLVAVDENPGLRIGSIVGISVKVFMAYVAWSVIP